MRPIFAFAVLLTITGGCSKGSNPITASSDTVTSGTLQYTLTTAKATYTTHDTLDVTLTVRNVGSVTDTLAPLGIGSAGLFWDLAHTSGKAVFAAEETDNAIILVPLPPGQSKLIATLAHALTDSSGNPLPAGSYTCGVDYSEGFGQILLSVSLTVQ